MQDSKPSFHENPEAELDRDDDDDSTRFNKSLQELKDLCSQLHYAANYCETSFLNAEHRRKKMKCGTPVAAKTSSNHEFETEEEVPLFLYTCNQKPSLTRDSSRKTDNPNSTSVLPVRDGLSVQPKAQNPSFHFEGTHKLKRNFLNWKSMQSNDILSIIRKSKRAM
ncbi:hypothetical protein Acr_11g0006650 [Actinidia rufa]|uniref:Uncharacterized protein n=1 Tax=Actinidia rufa TaxID=165716 RepID=A0A7J0FDS7_9ERIC|nr:hypothetical protein Acr_11g0006650 [Actinidia rufa]